jgi:glucosyl-3-phosphoglycerate synthase
VEVVVAAGVQVPDMGKEQGKGADMRRCLFEINRRCKSADDRLGTVVVFLDADVLPEYFGPHFVFGLAGAVFDGNDFAKASFWRDMGRVKKYLAQPLNSLINHPELDALTRLAYPLSGEVAGTLDFFNSVCFWQGYGVETGINIDACMGGYSIADVNLGVYDHEHRDDLAIQKMSFGILRTFFTQLIDYGIIELRKGAMLGDAYRASFIDPDGCRQEMEFELKEKKYRPLREVLG